jgi:hypothetical protein
VRTRRVESHSKLSDLNLGTIVEQGLVNEDTIEVGPIERSHVFNLEGATVSDKFCVAPGDRHIIKKNVSLRMPTRDR